MLTLSEELFMLTMYERRNSLVPSPSQFLPYALAGALLIDLIQEKKIHLEEGKKVLVDDNLPIGDPKLDTLLKIILSIKKIKKITYWIKVIGRKNKKLQKILIANLEAKRVLRVEKKCYLGMIPYNEYTQPDASGKYWLKQRLRAFILANDKPEDRTMYLLSLLKASNLLTYIFTEDEIKAANKRVDEYIKDESIGLAVAQIVDEITTAATAV